MTLSNVRWKLGLDELPGMTDNDWAKICLAAAPRTKLDGRADYLSYLNDRPKHEWTQEELDSVSQGSLRGHILANYWFDAIEVSRIVHEYKKFKEACNV